MDKLLIILDRKEFEERLSAYYWVQSPETQQAFLRAYGRGADTTAECRQAISDVVAGMSDMELGALAQAVLMVSAGAAQS